MKVLAWLSVVRVVLAVLSVIAVIAIPQIDARLRIFSLLWVLSLSPFYVGSFYLFKWLRNDSPKTRSKLPFAFKLEILADILFAIWQIFGALIIFKGDSLSGYIT